MHVDTDIPQREPVIFRAGETVKWDRDLSEHFSADDGWVLAYTIINADTRFTVSSTANVNKFSINIVKTDSAKFSAGTYLLVARVTKGTEEFGTFANGQRIYEGTLEIKPNVNIAVDIRSFAKRSLDAIEAVIEGRVTDDIMQYTIAGRLVVLMPPTELQMFHDRYKAKYDVELRKERIARGEASGGKVLERFVGR